MISLVLLVVVALLTLSILVTVHEFGHFVAAKLIGVWPEEFGIGLPPRVWGKKIGETIWSINALPFGGFVRLHGETLDPHSPHSNRSFVGKSKLARAFVALAGVSMNLIYAVLAFALIFFVLGVPHGVKVETVNPDSPAAAIGLKQNDVIESIDGRPLYNLSFFGMNVGKHAGKSISIDYKDAQTNETVHKQFVLRQFAPEGQGLLGISYNTEPAGYVEAKGLSKFFVSLQYGAYQTYDFSVLILGEFGKMFTQIFTGHMPAGLTGPLGVVGVTAQAASQGILDLINLTALISINLALINLVPFPPLDGSRVLFLIIEAFVGRKRLPAIEERVQTIGMYLLLILVVFLTFREVPKVFTSGSLEGFVQSLLK